MVDYVLIGENTGQWKPVFLHILCSEFIISLILVSSQSVVLCKAITSLISQKFSETYTGVVSLGSLPNIASNMKEIWAY